MRIVNRDNRNICTSFDPRPSRGSVVLQQPLFVEHDPKAERLEAGSGDKQTSGDVILGISVADDGRENSYFGVVVFWRLI
jgi:hypothetical protein